MAFPPAKNPNKGTPQKAYATESPATSTGNGGLAAAIKMKNANIKVSPGVEKTNAAS